MSSFSKQVSGAARPLVVVFALTGAAILFVAAPIPSWGQTGGGPGATSSGVQHRLTIEHALGSLLPRGLLPLHVTITRLGPAAACQRDTRYWVVSNSPEYGSGGYRRITDGVELVLGKGGTTLTGNVVLRPGDGWNNSVFVESDGNLNFAYGPNDHGVFYDTVQTSYGASGTNVQCLFVGKDQLDDMTTCTMTENLRQRYQNQARNSLNVLNSPPASTGNPVPSVWYLNEILGQANLQTYQGWTGMPTQAVATPAAPAVIDAAAHLDTFKAQQFIGWTSPDRLPDEWQGLLAADFIFISQPTLKGMVAGEPGRFQALREWVVAGGRLVISECGDGLAGLREIEADLFRLAEAERRSSWRTLAWSDVVAAVEQRRFELGSPPELPVQYDVNGFQTSDRPALPQLGMAGPDDTGLTNQGHPVLAQRGFLSNLALKTSRFDPGNQPGEGETVIAELGAGRIVAMPGSNADWQVRDWKRVVVAALSGAPGPLPLDSFKDTSQSSFPEAQMPGIGRPPWLPFMALIILFVIGVGPVAYSMLERRKRVPWMLAIVPGVATVCTLGLLVYALASEGLGSRSARMSYTRLDQNNRVALTRTQLIGYSGIAPGGFRFSRDEVLFPDKAPRYDLTTTTDADGRGIRGGAIRPRTVHQLQVARVAASEQALRVEPPGEGETDWEVTNRLGVQCGPVIVRTPDGWLVCETLAETETRRIKPADTPAFASWVNGQLAQPDSPLSKAIWLQIRLFEDDQSQAARIFQQIRLDQEFADGLGESRAQRALHRLLAASPAEEPHELFINEGCFLALAADQPLAARFPHQTRDMGELHLIHGCW